MSSAFFRRPTDESSSSSLESEGSEEAENSSPQIDDIGEGGHEIATTESVSSHGSVSMGDGHDAATTTSVTNVDHHRTTLLSALLEDFARNRACEILNNANPGSALHRLSAEIQPLARRLYEQISQSLSLTGILPVSANSDSTSSKQARATYLAGIEGLALGGGQIDDPVSGRPRPELLPPDHNLAIARASSRRQTPFSQLLQQPMIDLAMHRNRLSSPYADLTLSAPTTRRSHYESSFQQIRLLGKGGFGTVYHAYNLFDNKEYAVKKIPLSPRLSQRYRESGHQELENVLREVQALAQLEHNNVVRYHATWIEEPKAILGDSYQSRNSALAIPGRRLITEAPEQPPAALTRALVQPQAAEHSDGIVFGADSISQAAVQEIEDDLVPTWPMRQSELESTSARPSEIFTDGHARPSIPQNLVMDDSVYVLHVQMSVYPMTLAQYLAPAPANARSAPNSPIRRHCFHLVPALRLLVGILCGLQYIHAKGMVHRDIKPSNIFLSSLGFTPVELVSEGYHDVGSCIRCPASSPYYVNPRIGDFGLVAQLARDDGLVATDTRSTNGKPVGTQYYRPPSWTDSKGKLKAHSPVDESLDVFALGIILVELLWSCTTSTERLHVLRDLQKGKLPAGLVQRIDDEGHQTGTGALVGQCISGMIERDPRRRWGCAKVKEWVEMILRQCQTSTAKGVDGGEAENSAGDIVDKVTSLKGPDEPSRESQVGR